MDAAKQQACDVAAEAVTAVGPLAARVMVTLSELNPEAFEDLCGEADPTGSARSRTGFHHEAVQVNAGSGTQTRRAHRLIGSAVEIRVTCTERWADALDTRPGGRGSAIFDPPGS